MEREPIISTFNSKQNILDGAVHAEFGFVWTDGRAVFLSPIPDGGDGDVAPGIPALEATKVLGEFSDVLSCVWGPKLHCAVENFLAVQQKFCAVIWEVQPQRENALGLDCQKAHTFQFSSPRKGCAWHPSRPTLLTLSGSEVALCDANSGMVSIVHRGVDITAACWTFDGQRLMVADGQQLVIYDVDDNIPVKISETDMTKQGIPGSICSMTRITERLVAVTTELPLQKIITEISADLFTAEHVDFAGSSTEVRRTNCEMGTQSNEQIPVQSHGGDESCIHRTGTQEGILLSSTSEGKGVDCMLGSASAKLDHDIEQSILDETQAECDDGATMPAAAGADVLPMHRVAPQAGNSDFEDTPEVYEGDTSRTTSLVADTCVTAQENIIDTKCRDISDRPSKQVLEAALKDTKGPVDLTQLLSQLKSPQSGSTLLPSDFGSERKCADGVEANLNPEKDGTTSPGNTLGSGDGGMFVRGEDADSYIDELRHVQMSQPGDAQLLLHLDEAESPVCGKEDFLHTDNPVDLTSLKSVETTTVPHFKHATMPGAGSTAELFLFDTALAEIVSRHSVEGIISPSLLIYKERPKCIVVGSGSTRALSVFPCSERDALLQPFSMELEEMERPAGLLSLPDDRVLVAVTKPSSPGAGLGAVLPPSGQSSRRLMLKCVSMATALEQVKERNRIQPLDPQPTTSPPGNDGSSSLQTLLLPDGRAIDAKPTSEGKKAGIEVIGDEKPWTHAPKGARPGGGAHSAVAMVTSSQSQYPSPQTAGVVRLQCMRMGDVVERSFLLQDGLLRLQTVKDVFRLYHAEIQIGDHWIVLTQDKDGFVPLSFDGGSVYRVQEATI
ncbi:uncharacterized protein [Diadema setosum]|uniref:uncharacterized protein n=1 Tax=Diadema setosum TaxID=31175 RepID=UPI003B3A045F